MRDLTRRSLVRGGAATLVATALAACAGRADHDADDVPPTEDLMREHGVLRRVLLVYEAMEPRLDRGASTPIEVAHQAATIVRSFIEDYHERQEEEDLFPRFAADGRHAALVAVLKRQHDVGRALTEAILSDSAQAPDAAARARLAENMRSFARLYRPHAAREDTVLFPDVRRILSPEEYRDLGERFEARERQLFGADGFAKMVAQVADLERRVGIDDLAAFG